MALSKSPVVGIVGMAALRRDVNRMTDDVSGPLYAAIKRAGLQVAEPVAAAVRARLPSGPRTTGRLQGDVRVGATRTGASVRMGRKTVPYAGWVEFGGTRKRPWPSERPFVKDGRYLFPAARDLSAQTAADYTAALQAVFDSPGVWTNTTTSPGAVHD
jgi:hypothetical protein